MALIVGCEFADVQKSVQFPAFGQYVRVAEFAHPAAVLIEYDDERRIAERCDRNFVVR